MIRTFCYVFLLVCFAGLAISLNNSCTSKHSTITSNPYGQPPAWDGSQAIRNAMCALGHVEFCDDGPSPVAAPDFSGSISWEELDAEDKAILGPYWMCSNPEQEITYTCRWGWRGWECTIDWSDCAGWDHSK